MGVPVVASPVAAGGIDAVPGEHFLVADGGGGVRRQDLAPDDAGANPPGNTPKPDGRVWNPITPGPGPCAGWIGSSRSACPKRGRAQPSLISSAPNPSTARGGR